MLASALYSLYAEFLNLYLHVTGIFALAGAGSNWCGLRFRKPLLRFSITIAVALT